MNTKTFLPLTAAALFVVCTGSMLFASQSLSAAKSASADPQPIAHMEIVDMPTVTVQASAEELAFYHANRIVDLAAVTVRPSAEDLALLAAEQATRIVDLPAVTVRPSTDDLQMVAIGAATVVQQLATR